MEQARPTDTDKPVVPPDAAASAESETDNAPVQRVPARYKLYDRLNVSLKTMDLIITVVIVLIVAALIVGIVIK